MNLSDKIKGSQYLLKEWKSSWESEKSWKGKVKKILDETKIILNFVYQHWEYSVFENEWLQSENNLYIGWKQTETSNNVFIQKVHISQKSLKLYPFRIKYLVNLFAGLRVKTTC